MHWSVIVLVVLGVYLFIRFYYARPDFPPLTTEPGDPSLQEAGDRARNNVDQLVELYRKFPEQALVKIKFLSNSGQVEYLWGEIREIQGEEIQLFLVTPPVSHGGKLDRNTTVNIKDLEDWQVTDDDGKIHGGFSQRAMFKIARERWGKLPRKLARMEERYKS